MRAAALFLFFTACGPVGRNPPANPTPGRTSGGGDTSGNGTGSNNSNSNGGDCSEEAKLVYTVDVDGRFASFKPDTLTFTDIGKLSCPARGGANPFGMTVDRSATAWVLYDSSEMFHVDTKTAACTPTNFPQNQPGFGVFGLGFVSDSADSSSETMFVGGVDNQLTMNASLGAVDPTTLIIKKIRSLASPPDMTGTGDGQLWGFFATASPARIANLDKTTGEEGKSFNVPGISLGGAWAFAHWGGDFWLFVAQGSLFGGFGESAVHHVHSSDGSIETPLPKTGRTIVGAGVSTCAPTVIQ